MTDRRKIRDWAAGGGLTVRTRGAAEPQRVAIDASLTAPDPDRRIARYLLDLVEEIAAGGAGGAELPPTAGASRLLTGPRPGDPEAEGPTLHAELEVAGVSPRYWRHVVELFGHVPGLQALRIAGELPPDGGPLSATELDVLRWAEEPGGHLGRHAAPFAVRVVPRNESPEVFVRVALADTATPDILEAFDQVLLVWGGMLRSYGPPPGSGQAFAQLVPLSGRSDAELCARFTRVRVERAPAADLLVNLMASFHVRVCPIERLDLGMSM